MGISASDYDGYGRQFLTKSDLTPKVLKRYGIKASVKKIQSNYLKAYDGYVMTGGHDYYGVPQKRRTSIYSIRKLKDILK